VARLIGSPPGYVGHEAGGQLVEAVRRRPYQVVLLDEAEKAHPDVLKLLLQVLEEGRLTDGRGRTVDFANTIVILTSNLGSEHFCAGRRAVGFQRGAAEAIAPGAEAAVLEQARRHFAPELWNRIEERLVFSPLSREDLARVARLQVADSSARLARERGITYEADAAAVEHLLENGGWSPELGARPMRQAIQALVEGPLAERILRGELRPGDHVLVRGGPSGLRFEGAGQTLGLFGE
jgi:ATP-dependent Clp protease ATP-binding subunit ClpC